VNPAGTAPPPASARLDGGRLRQIAVLTLGAVLLYWGSRYIPTGSNLHPNDFATGGPSMIELCDPANPQFIPVVAVRSPISTRLAPATAGEGEATAFTLTLRTASDKPIGPVDLITTHTRKLHLMVIDPSLEDYQHLHPEPGAQPGEWVYTMTPRRAGDYRVFADFVPAATGRGLYASAEFSVPGEARPPDARPVERVDQDGLRFTLRPNQRPWRAREQVELTFGVERLDGGPVQLERVMDAYAHLVAFDAQRSGFAHLHPDATEIDAAPDAYRPELQFRVLIPSPGWYAIWAQVAVDGVERYVPFWFRVE
jgi:hypothetical protein